MIFSDSEGTQSDFEVISSTSTKRVNYEGSKANNRLSTGSDTTIIAKDSTEVQDSLDNASELFNDSLSSSSNIFQDAVYTESTQASDESLDESKTCSGSLIVQQRRERRDTDRQRRKKSHDERLIEKRLTGITFKDAFLALAVLGGCTALLTSYRFGHAEQYQDIEKLKEKVADLEMTNKLLISQLRSEEESFKTKYLKEEKNNRKMKQTLTNLQHKLKDLEKKLQRAEGNLKDLKNIAEDDSYHHADRYGFDVTFKLCLGFVAHEKLCRLITEGLKTVSQYDSV